MKGRVTYTNSTPYSDSLFAYAQWSLIIEIIALLICSIIFAISIGPIFLLCLLGIPVLIVKTLILMGISFIFEYFEVQHAKNSKDFM